MGKVTKHRRWLKIIGGLALLFCILFAAAYYIAAYRIKDVLRIVVEKQSNGLYSFDADDADLSFTKRRVVLKNVVINCSDTINTKRHYSINIPDIYLSIHSFRQILFHKNVLIDSMSIGKPFITLHDHEHSVKRIHAGLESPDIVSSLKNILAHLQVKKFHLHEAGFAYSNKFQPKAFNASHINFSVIDFSKQNNSSGSFLASQEIAVDVTGQSWELPDGNHMISFKKLHFSGHDQLFQLDSCVIHAKPMGARAGFTFSAEKLFFSSSQLSKLYESRELSLDTLICVKPSLIFQPPASTGNRDTAGSKAAFQLFNRLQIHYIDIRDGEFLMGAEGRSPSYVTPKQNLLVYNLLLDPAGSKPVSVDSIRLNLQAIAFVTKDSLFQLNIQSFDFGRNELVLRNARYGPTNFNHSHRGMEFSTPLLRIQNVSIGDLLQKKLSGTLAELDQPSVQLIATETGERNISTGIDREQKLELFYKNLHGLGELLNVDSLRINQGQLQYKAAARNLTAQIDGFATLLLMKKLLQSDSMIEIKRAMPFLNIHRASVKSPALDLRLTNYVFKGMTQQNHIDLLQLSLANKNMITLKNVGWEAFDWDTFARSKKIMASSLRIDDAVVRLQSPQHKKTKTATGFPPIQIGKIELNKLFLNLLSANDTLLQLSGDGISLSKASTQNKVLVWENIYAQLHRAKFRKQGLAVSMPLIVINSAGEDLIQNVTFNINSAQKNILISIPAIKSKLDLKSTDPAAFNLHSMVIQRPKVDISILQKNQKTTARSPAHLPFNLNTTLLDISDAQLSYKDNTSKTEIRSRVNASLTGLQSKSEVPGVWQFLHSSFSLSDLHYAHNKMQTDLSRAGLRLDKGTLATKDTEPFLLRSLMNLDWAGLTLQVKKTDSTGLQIKNHSGVVNSLSLELKKNEKLPLNKWLAHTTISNTDIQFADTSITAGISDLNWTGPAQKLYSSGFHLTPKKNMEETFVKADWQKDHMEITGRSLGMNGLNFYLEEGKPALEIKNIELDSVHHITARDKRIPFKHGIEVFMPTSLLNSIKMPLKVDSVFVRNSAVTVYEISKITQKKGMIPITDLNAVITNLTNHPNTRDSLYILANASVVRNRITNMRYAEAYADSLSGFVLSVNIAPMQLTHFSDATIPLASVKVHNGYADTLYAKWLGNKYAAFGTMNFHYNDLAIRILDKKEPSRKRLLLGLESWAANLILRNRNRKQSLVFMERDREKFVFNYWVKTSMSGLLTSAGIKRNRKYYKNWKQFLKKHQLESWGLDD